MVNVLFLLVYKHVANFAQGVESEHASDRVKKNMSNAKQRVFWASGEQTLPDLSLCVGKLKFKVLESFNVNNNPDMMAVFDGAIQYPYKRSITPKFMRTGKEHGISKKYESLIAA